MAPIDRVESRAVARGQTGVPLLIGESPEIRAVLRQIEKIGPSAACVLIQGETGSGKELAARTIHAISERRHQAFVAVNCGAVPDSLIETELFGHGKGAFTDAKEARAGVIAQAERGTLFLDETDTLSPKAQVALLRFLQDFRYRPIGTAIEIASNVRIIAAANQDLQTLIDEGRFRRDLLYRLNIFELWIPPLRGRPADIELLADHFIQQFSDKYGISPKRLHPATLEWLRRHDWPGNVRELENWIHRELLLTEGDEIRHLPARETTTAGAPPGDSTDLRTAKARALAEFESTYVARVLAEANGNVTLAARLAGKAPALDLDSVYGRGPFEDSQLYQRDRTKLRVEGGGLFEDLPRTPDGTAIIADPRNDENLMIAGLQVAMLKFHNRIVDMLRDDRWRDPRSIFSDARKIATWHYQWIIVHEFLPAIVGPELVSSIFTRGLRFYRPRAGEQTIPVEFQGAAYRFGHSMVRRPIARISWATTGRHSSG